MQPSRPHIITVNGERYLRLGRATSRQTESLLTAKAFARDVLLDLAQAIGWLMVIGSIVVLVVGLAPAISPV